MIFFSFLAAIAIGSSLLVLPQATVSGNISPIDAIFTATSAVCVTGLTVVDTGTYFTRFGQSVILVLMQIGGLGIMTFAVIIFQLIGRSVSFKQRMAVQDVFAHTPRADIYHLLKSIIIFTGVAELIGAALLFFRWGREYTWDKALFYAVFHSVSAFCNAGFALFSDSLEGFRAEPFLVSTIGFLIILGGVGFPVVYDIFITASRRHKRQRLSVQTKSVLTVTVILIVAGMLVFWEVERNTAFSGYSWSETMLASFFQSITSRTAGFYTVDMTALSERSLAFMMFLMFFGASPGSCGGGVKTTTLAVISVFAWSRTRRQTRVNMFKRSVPTETVTKATSLILLSITFIGLVIYLLLLSNEGDAGGLGSAHGSFMPLMFEAVSAFGTVGLSLGVTAGLNSFGKVLIILTMLVGRIGILAFSYIIAGPSGAKGIEYAEEDLMIG